MDTDPIEEALRAIERQPWKCFDVGIGKTKISMPDHNTDLVFDGHENQLERIRAAHNKDIGYIFRSLRVTLALHRGALVKFYDAAENETDPILKSQFEDAVIVLCELQQKITSVLRDNAASEWNRR
jgi:hypothetical protein